MEPLINQVHRLLLKNKKTVSVAESCSGGLLCELLTRISGSSAFFILGVVAYSNQAKEKILRIPHALLLEKGAVSREVAQKLAGAVRRLAKTDFGIGVTGIAGPTRGTAKKPVGTVYIAVESRNKKISHKFLFSGNRAQIRRQSVLKALQLLKKIL